MYIDHENKIVFFCNPKTGSTTIKRLLGGDESQKPHLYHITPSLMVADGILTQKQLEEYFTFTFIRNPFARFLSTYLHGIQAPDNYKAWSIDLFKFDDFRDFALRFHESDFTTEAHFRKQVDYIKWTNFVGKYENYLSDIENAFRRINRLSLLSGLIPRVHATNKDKKTIDYYDKESIKAIAKYYAEDFEVFDYDPNWGDICQPS